MSPSGPGGFRSGIPGKSIGTHFLSLNLPHRCPSTCLYPLFDPCYDKTRNARAIGTYCIIRAKEVFSVADTKKVEDKLERKKIKRTARKKAAPKAKRTAPRGSNKKKVKKLVRGVSKR